MTDLGAIAELLKTLGSGYIIEDEGGDLVVKDPDGNVVLRRTADTDWDFDGEDVKGIASLTATSVTADSATVNGTTTTDSLDADSITINNTRLSSPTLTVADDGVKTVDVGGDQFIQVFGDQGNTFGVFTAAFGTLNTIDVGTKVTNQGSTDLTGTTGPDGTLNISNTDTTLHLENRVGNSLEIDVVRFTR